MVMSYWLAFYCVLRVNNNNNNSGRMHTSSSKVLHLLTTGCMHP